MEDTQSLVDSLIIWAGRLVPDRDRTAELERGLRTALADGTLNPAQPVSRDSLDAVEVVCHRTARHLTFDLHEQPGPPDQESPGWPPVPRAEVEGRAGFVRSVLRPAGASFGELRLDGFDDAEHAGRYLHAAFGLLDGVDGLVLDLRHNGGGAVSTLAMLAEFVLGPEPEHLATVYYRDRPTRQWWTTGGLTQVHLPASARVAMLIGPGTYSSGEAVAYHLQSRGRVRTFRHRDSGRRRPRHADPADAARDRPDAGGDDDRPTDRDQLGGSRR